MIKTSFRGLVGGLSLGLALLTLGVPSVQAEDVFVTTYKGTVTTTDATPAPYCTYTGSVSASGTSTSSTATPAAPTPGRRARFGFSSGCTWTVQPDDNAGFGFSKLQSPGAYKVYVTKGTSGSSAADLLVNMTVTSGANLYDLNGVAQASIATTNFCSGASNNVWLAVGIITNTSANPQITFTHASGSVSRFYMDAVRFENIGDPCFGITPGQPAATGPLSAGQTFVNVTGITAGSTNVKVFAEASQIGVTNFASGFAAGSLTVPCSALVKGAQITASQTKSGCSSQLASGGPRVGGGANPQIKIVLSCSKNSTLTGPAGANGTLGGGVPYFLSASTFRAGFNTAPIPGIDLNADPCWQLVTFNDHGNMDAIDQNTGGHITNTDTYCALEGLIFSINADDSGPYNIYVDSIMNGNTVIENFEGYTPGKTNTLVTPAIATAPAPGATYLSAPNSSLTSGLNSYDGTNACRIQWQYSDTNGVRWTHVLASGATGGKVYPQLDTTKPTTMRVLVLPVGTSSGSKFNGTAGNVTGASPAYTTGSNLLSVTVTGAGTYTYQWSLAGNAITDATNSTYYAGGAFGLNSGDSGTYSVAISDGTCTETRSADLTVVDPIPTVTNQPTAKTIAHVGNNVTWTAGGDGHVPAGYPLTYQWQFNGADITDATSSSFTTNNVQVANAGDYTVVVGNSYGSVTSSVAILDVVQPGVVIGTGTGLRGDYYNHTYTNNPFGGAPVLTRTDPTVNFNFGSGSPGAGIGIDLFTIRWSGQVQALDTDTYTFYVKSDDGQRLWVNGTQLVNDWVPHGATEHNGTIDLTANQKYDIVYEYFENGVAANAVLSWSTAGGGVAKEVIPQSQLYPATGPAKPTVTSSVNNGTNLVFSWGAGTYNLQSSTVVTGVYSTVTSGVISPFTIVIDPAAPQKYYRLQVQ
jgi:hypothetical protein